MTTVTNKIKKTIKRFDNQFLKPDIRTQLAVSEITNDHDELRWAEQGEENLESFETVTDTFENVSLCRLSAPGFLDCTDWNLCHDEDDILEWIEREAENLEQ